MHHHGNVHSHSGMTQASHLHTGHHHPGHGLINIGSAGALADIHGLDLESIGKLNSGNNNNNNNGMTGNNKKSFSQVQKIDSGVNNCSERSLLKTLIYSILILE